MTRPSGVLCFLNEQSQFPSGSDDSFLEKIDSHLTSNPCYQKARAHRAFTIKHFASDVTYSVDGFLAKNKDALPIDSITLLSVSSDAVIRSIFEPLIALQATAEASSARRSSTAATRFASQKFVEQLSELMNELHRSELLYVKCLKSNSLKQAGCFDGASILRQLRFSGLIDACRIRQSGYAERFSFEKFCIEFGDGSGKDRSTCIKLLHALEIGRETAVVGTSTVFAKNSRLLRMSKEMKTLEDQVEEFRIAWAGQAALLESSIAARGQAEKAVEELKAEVEEWQETRKADVAAIEYLNTQLAAAAEERKHNDCVREELEAKVNELRQQAEQSAAEAMAAKRTIAEMQENASESAKAELSTLRSQLTAAKFAAEQALIERDAAVAERAQVMADCEQLEQECGITQEELRAAIEQKKILAEQLEQGQPAHAPTRLGSDEVRDLQNEVMHLQSEIGSLRVENSVLLHRLSPSEEPGIQALAPTRDESLQLQRENEELRRQLSMQNQANTDPSCTTSEISALQAEVVELRERAATRFREFLRSNVDLKLMYQIPPSYLVSTSSSDVEMAFPLLSSFSDSARMALSAEAGTHELRKFLGISTAADPHMPVPSLLSPQGNEMHGDVRSIKKEELQKKKKPKWKDRYFFLQGAAIYCYKTKSQFSEGKNAYKTVRLDVPTVISPIDQPIEAAGEGGFGFEILQEDMKDGKRLMVQVKSKPERDKWVSLLVSCTSLVAYQAAAAEHQTSIDPRVQHFLAAPDTTDLNLSGISEHTELHLKHAWRPMQYSQQLQTLVLRNCALNEASLGPLTQVVATSHSLLRLHLQQNQFVACHSLVQFAKSVQASRSLLSLSLDANRLGDQGMAQMAIAITKPDMSAKHHHQLNQMTLSANEISDAGVSSLEEALSTAQNPKFTTLSLAYNRIGDGGAAKIAKLCLTNNAIVRLELQHNEIGDYGATALADLLPQHASGIQTMLLTANLIGDAGMAALAKSLSTKASLTHIDVGCNPVATSKGYEAILSQFQPVVLTLKRPSDANHTRTDPIRPTSTRTTLPRPPPPIMNAPSVSSQSIEPTARGPPKVSPSSGGPPAKAPPGSIGPRPGPPPGPPPSVGPPKVPPPSVGPPKVPPPSVGPPKGPPPPTQLAHHSKDASPAKPAPAKTSVSSAVEDNTSTSSSSSCLSSHEPSPRESAPQVERFAEVIADFTQSGQHKLHFKKGDIVKIIKAQAHAGSGNQGWWYGEVNGQGGWFPSSHVTMKPASFKPPAAAPAEPPTSTSAPPSKFAQPLSTFNDGKAASTSALPFPITSDPSPSHQTADQDSIDTPSTASLPPPHHMPPPKHPLPTNSMDLMAQAMKSRATLHEADKEADADEAAPISHAKPKLPGRAPAKHRHHPAADEAVVSILTERPESLHFTVPTATARRIESAEASSEVSQVLSEQGAVAQLPEKAEAQIIAERVDSQKTDQIAAQNQTQQTSTTRPTRPTVKMGTAICAYEATDETQLSLEEGDKVTLVKTDIPGGWSYGSCKGKLGYFPGTFVEEDKVAPSASMN
jgi:Ran GTPase-activating protein (RanGAP) involved in mRNA processing and transport